MPSERPLLLFASPASGNKEPRPRAIPFPTIPSQDSQIRRFGPRINRLHQILQRENPAMDLRDDPLGIAPERTLVFEVAGSIENFSSQAEALGFTFLGESPDEFDPSDEWYYQQDRTKKVASTLYLVMPDLHALEQMTSLWKSWTERGRLDVGYGKWTQLFKMLHDIRVWGPRDRLTDEFKDALNLWVQSDTDQPFRFEIDLWLRRKDEREIARQETNQALDALGGRRLDEALIEPISWHGFLAEVPRSAIELMRDTDESPLTNPLYSLDSIMYLRPQAMSAATVHEVTGTSERNVPEGLREPVAALLDGYPFSNHSCLHNRLIIDDFLSLEGDCPANQRRHGTAMASLILHGDMHLSEEPIKSSLLVLPVLRPDPANSDHCEVFPPDRLIVDIIYRAVSRIMIGEDGEAPVGSGVVVINHSLGDRQAPYCPGRISPWARLLDYLAFQHKVLFITSAGNHEYGLPVYSYATATEFESASQEQKRRAYHESLAQDKQNRPLLSPAEALNPITVGAWHADACPNNGLPTSFVDILPDKNGPSIISALGLGHKKAVKPDIYYDGGRALVSIRPNGECCELRPLTKASRFSGQSVAAPSERGDINSTANTFGTSNAAALLTRQAIRIHEMLDDLSGLYPNSAVPKSHQAVLIKALLAHGCEWGEPGDYLEGLIEPAGSKQWNPRRTEIARFLGFGRPDIERVLACTSQRATLIGWDTIRVDERRVYCLPLPSSLSGRRNTFRRMTITLAWLTPVNSRHQQYRQAVLELREMRLSAKTCGTERGKVMQPPETTVSRGTIAHHIFQGSRGASFNGDLELVVECRAQAGSLDDDVPYALAVSFEVGVDSGIDVYEEVRAKLPVQPRTPVAVR